MAQTTFQIVKALLSKLKSLLLAEQRLSNISYNARIADCGCPFSTIPFFEPTAMLQSIEAQLKKIESKIDRLG